MNAEKIKERKITAVILKREHRKVGDKGLLKLLNVLESSEGESVIKKYMAWLPIMFSQEAMYDARVVNLSLEQGPVISMQASVLHELLVELLVEYLDGYSNDMETFFSMVLASQETD